MSNKYYICEICGNQVEMVKESGVKTVCCGKPMKEIIAGEVEASAEKHIPVVSVLSGKVEVFVGSVLHPMTEEHHIAWVALETKQGTQRKNLSQTGEPKVEFSISSGDEVIAVYAYCNLHGLWKFSV